MTREEVDEILQKYQERSERDDKYGYDKCALYARIVRNLERDINDYVDNDDFETEADIIHYITDRIEEAYGFYDGNGDSDEIDGRLIEDAGSADDMW